MKKSEILMSCFFCHCKASNQIEDKKICVCNQYLIESWPHVHIEFNPKGSLDRLK